MVLGNLFKIPNNNSKLKIISNKIIEIIKYLLLKTGGRGRISSNLSRWIFRLRKALGIMAMLKTCTGVQIILVAVVVSMSRVPLMGLQ